jgi:hypothetical protein
MGINIKLWGVLKNERAAKVGHFVLWNAPQTKEPNGVG